MENKYKLTGYELCPYVHRTRMILAYLNIPYEMEQIDLQNKPAWFLALSPTGKVPMLLVNDKVLFESSAINEYLAEVAGVALLPKDPMARAQNRAWTEFNSSLVMQHVILFGNSTNEENYKVRAVTFNEALGHVEQVFAGGPFFNGTDFNLIDAAYASLFLRIDALEKYYPGYFLADKPKLSAWSQALLQLTWVKAAIPDDYESMMATRLKSSESYMVRKLSDHA